MTTPLPPFPTSSTITLDGSSGAGERAFLDLFTCRCCGHSWDSHGKTGAVPPSKSRCQLPGCNCARFGLPDK